MTESDDRGSGPERISEADRQAQARRERAARTLRENLLRRKQQGRARRAGDADEAVGLPAIAAAEDAVAALPTGTARRPDVDHDGAASAPDVSVDPAPAVNPDESTA